MPRCQHVQGAEKEYGIMPNNFFTELMPLGKDLHLLFFSNLPIAYTPDHLLDLAKEGIVSDIWLKNAGRLYIDRSHPEYSTPECATARDSVIWQKAGDRIMADVVQTINQKLWAAIRQNKPTKEITNSVLQWAKRFVRREHLEAESSMANGHMKHLEPGSEIFRIYRNSIDTPNKNMFSDHGNHAMRRTVNFEDAASVLLLHLISCPLWQGSGKVVYVPEKKRFEYRLSQRELCTDNVQGNNASDPYKNLLSTRDQPHADKNDWYRIHIVGWDANMAEVAMRLKDGTVMLLILMLEGGFFTDKNLHHSPIRLRDAYRHFCGDLTFKTPYPLLGGQYSALDLQMTLLRWAEEYFAGKNYEFLNAEIQWQLAWWRKILVSASASDPMRALSPYADHAAKYCLIESDMRRRGYSWTDDPDRELMIQRKDGRAERMTVRGRLNWLDLEYHRISHVYGIFQRIPLERVSTDAEILHAIGHAPPHTRASARRIAMDMFEDQYPQSKIVKIDWEDVYGLLPGRHAQTYCRLLNPFESRLLNMIPLKP